MSVVLCYLEALHEHVGAGPVAEGLLLGRGEPGLLHGGGVGGAALPPAARVHVGAVLRDRVYTSSCQYWHFYVDEDEKY